MVSGNAVGLFPGERAGLEGRRLGDFVFSWSVPIPCPWWDRVAESRGLPRQERWLMLSCFVSWTFL